MTQKQYVFWNAENIYQAPASRSVTVDYWTTLDSADLTWHVSTAGFDNIQLNGYTISTASSGTQNVKQYLKLGQKNTVVLNYRCGLETIIFGQAAGNAQVNLTLNGSMGTYEIILTQNRAFKQAYLNCQISLTDYQQAIAFQNVQLQQLLALGLITAEQYTTALAEQNLNPQGSDGSNIGGSGSDDRGSFPTPTFNGIPLNIILIAAGIAVLAIALYLWNKRGGQ